MRHLEQISVWTCGDQLSLYKPLPWTNGKDLWGFIRKHLGSLPSLLSPRHLNRRAGHHLEMCLGKEWEDPWKRRLGERRGLPS